MSKIVAYVTKNRVGRPDEKQRVALAAFMTAQNIKPEIVEDAYSKKKPWRKRKELSVLAENARSGDTIVFPAIEHLGCDAADRIALLSELMKRGVAVHLVAEGIVLKNFSEEGIALFGLFSVLLNPGKKTPGRKPGRKPGRPAKKKRGRPPKKKVGRPKIKKKPGRKPARKKRVSALQQQFNDKILTIRTYLKNRFSVKTVAEMLEMPYLPLLALIKKHETLKDLVKKGR